MLTHPQGGSKCPTCPKFQSKGGCTACDGGKKRKSDALLAASTDTPHTGGGAAAEVEPVEEISDPEEMLEVMLDLDKVRCVKTGQEDSVRFALSGPLWRQNAKKVGVKAWGL
jgi:hypothetical protein